MVNTTAEFIASCLPKGELPNYLSAQNSHEITIPFAVQRYSDGLDYGEDDDGNQYVYQDEPPSWYLYGAFLTREDAERFVESEQARGVTGLEIDEDITVGYWQFLHCHVG